MLTARELWLLEGTGKASIGRSVGESRAELHAKAAAPHILECYGIKESGHGACVG